jgi:transcription elongation factor Elf1
MATTLLNIKQDTVGQFICSMRGHHTISNENEDKLDPSKNKKFQTTCNLCGIRVIVEMDSINKDIYIISRVPEF